MMHSGQTVGLIVMFCSVSVVTCIAVMTFRVFCLTLKTNLPWWDAPYEDPVAYLEAIQLYRMN